MKPTDEQAAIIEVVRTGVHTSIEAYAGTGKTSTLQLLAEDRPDLRMKYVAFNRPLVDEAKLRFPDNVSPSTSHGLAGSKRAPQARRLNWDRQSPTELAKLLDTEPVQATGDFGKKRFGAGWFASTAIATIATYCRSPEMILARKHISWPDSMMPSDSATTDLWRPVRDELTPLILSYARQAWDDITNTQGRIKWDHNYYLKMWQLSEPQIQADVILYDEAQDANGVMLAITEAQRDHCQLVYVGDRFQQIYGWNGAVNAMSGVNVDETRYLTGSFRFGPRIAAEANRILEDVLEAPSGIRGLARDGTVGPIVDPDVILCRSNSGIIAESVKAVSNGRKPHVVGGTFELVSFARAAGDLKAGRSTLHRELSCFSTWGEVVEYAEQDQMGQDLASLVKIVEKHGPAKIIKYLDTMVEEADADVLISSGHRAKGREWKSVALYEDFGEPVYSEEMVLDEDQNVRFMQGPLVNDEEMRLLYVSITRAQHHLDHSRVEWLNPKGSR